MFLSYRTIWKQWFRKVGDGLVCQGFVGFVPDEQSTRLWNPSFDGFIDWGFLQLGRDSDGFTGRDPALNFIELSGLAERKQESGVFWCQRVGHGEGLYRDWAEGSVMVPKWLRER